jgi:bifunctional non-homologous end joining protein LigD
MRGRIVSRQSQLRLPTSTPAGLISACCSRRSAAGGGKRAAELATLSAFDLLYLDGHDLKRMTLAERRHMLEDLLAGESGMLRLSEEIRADGAAFLAEACQLGLEGIIAKRRDAPHRSGRGGNWLKIKCIQSDTFLIIGYEPSIAVLGGIGGYC